jgi:hypothetical protein
MSDSLEIFYNINPNLRPEAIPAFTPLSTPHATVDDPIIISDSSDGEDEYTAASSSPIFGDSILDIAKKKLAFYKHLLEPLNKYNNASHAKQSPPNSHQNVKSRSERKAEKSARIAERKRKRRPLVAHAGAPRQAAQAQYANTYQRSLVAHSGAPGQYVSQQAQARNVNRVRPPKMRQSVSRTRPNM